MLPAQPWGRWDGAVPMLQPGVGREVSGGTGMGVSQTWWCPRCCCLLGVTGDMVGGCFMGRSSSLAHYCGYCGLVALCPTVPWTLCACPLAPSLSPPSRDGQRGWWSPALPILPGLQLSLRNPLPVPTHQLIPWLIPQSINTALPQRALRPCGHPTGQVLDPRHMGKSPCPSWGQVMSFWGQLLWGQWDIGQG